MRQRWRIAKIFGIDIRIDSSWVVIFILFTWVLAGNYFPQNYPQWSKPLTWMMGILTSLLVFASVLAHELTHSLVAKSQGEEVRSITLFILGGVAQISGEPKQPLRELAMAVVGPLSSFILAGLFFMAAFFLRDISEPLSASALYLSTINTVLAIFNLLPGFPMDGGRVLRSIIWKLTGDLKRATRIASRAGQAVAFLLMIGGFLQILRGGLSGLWLILIGWFLHSAAVQGYEQVVFQSLLQDVRAKDIMTTDFITVSPGLSLQALVDEFILKTKNRIFLITEGEVLLGIICLEDVKATPRERWQEVKVEDVMTPRQKMESVSPETEGTQVLKSLAAREVNQLPVMEEGRLVGIICRQDVLKFIQLKTELGA